MATSAALSGDTPAHYYSGQVCAAEGDKPEVLPGGRPCGNPISGATVTLRNSVDKTVTTQTDKNGRYSMEPIPLLGSDADSALFEATDFVSLRLIEVMCDPDAAESNDIGATIFLPTLKAATIE